jgi:ketosteroid isomerase-like protein
MKAILAIIVALAAAPLAAQEPTPEQADVIAAAKAFLFAIGNPDRTALAEHMIPEGMIFVHNRMNPDAPRVDAVPVAQHLERWTGRTGRFIEQMTFTTVLVDGDMAQVWGPYRFLLNSEISHCGINSLSMVKTADGWKVANTSFTMEPPGECERLGAPGDGE